MSAQDGTPRRVLVAAEIRTWGKSCVRWTEPGPQNSCGYLFILNRSCRLHLQRLRTDPAQGTPLRCPQCLALDEPAPDTERTPEEAMRHGLGAQDG